MKIGGKLILAAVALSTSACASMTPTVTTSDSYWIYDVKPGKGVTPGMISSAVEDGLRKYMTSVQISNNIPPDPLPAKATRFKMVNPFAGTTLGALTQAAPVPQCSGAIVTAHSANSNFMEYGQQTSFFLCVMPYIGGYQVDAYAQFTKKTGGLDPATLGGELTSSVLGDSSKFIGQTVAAVKANLAKTGSAVALVDAYPAGR